MAYYRVFAAPTQSDYQRFLSQQSPDAINQGAETFDAWKASGGRGRLLKNTSSKNTARQFAAKTPGSIFDFQGDQRGGIAGAVGGAFDRIGAGLGDMIDEPGIQALIGAGLAGGAMGAYGGAGAGTAGGSTAGNAAIMGMGSVPTTASEIAMADSLAASFPAGMAGGTLAGAGYTGTAGSVYGAANPIAAGVSAPITNASLSASPLNAGVSAVDEYGMSQMGEMGGSTIANAGAPTGGAAYTGTGPGLGVTEEAAMLGIADAPLATNWGAGAMSLLKNPDTYGVAGSLYQMYQANQAQDAYEEMLREMNSDQYDYRQNDDLVQQYLRDPMGLLKKHPGYQASVDFVTKQGMRQNAAKGYSGSGNASYYLADTLAKNASDWHEKLWNPIAQSAGLSNYPNKSALGQVGVNAQSQIDRAERSASHEIFNAGRKLLPEIFKNWT